MMSLFFESVSAFPITSLLSPALSSSDGIVTVADMLKLKVLLTIDSKSDSTLLATAANSSEKISGEVVSTNVTSNKISEVSSSET